MAWRFDPLPALTAALDGRDRDEISTAAGIPRVILDAVEDGTAFPGPELEAQLSELLDVPGEILFAPHRTIVRLNAGRQLVDPDVGGRVASTARSRIVTRL